MHVRSSISVWCAVMMLVAAVGSAPLAAAPPEGGQESPEVPRVVSPRAGLTGNEVSGNEDVEGGPIAEGEQLRRWTPLTQAELDAPDPSFREWVESIRSGRADKRIMRLYWFYRSRLDPFDEPVPRGWRQRAADLLRDSERSRAAAEQFERTRGEPTAAEDPSSDPLRGDPPSPPSGSILDAAARRDAPPQSSGVDAGTGVSTYGVWVPIGPYTIAGRTTGLDRPADRPEMLYAAVADGGVWRTRDRGQSWERLSDFESTLSGGAILLDPTDPDIIYFGTGEGNGAIDNYPGIGVLKSTDAGLTWTPSNQFSNAVRRLAIHATEPTRIWAAGDQGCYVSTDAGANFSLVDAPGLPTGTGASDVLIRPDNPDWVYCALWGGAAGGIYRSTDRGQNWVQLTNGLPTPGTTGRIALAVSQSNTNRLVAGIDISSGTIYRSDDGGDNWINPEATPLNYCGGQCWYDNVVGIDPVDENIIYAGGISAYRSFDGGVNWELMSSGVHVDHHFIFTPTAGEVILANDGGIYHSDNNGSSWSEWSIGMDTTQYYGICRHPTDDFWAFGGTQDNGSHRRRQSDGWSQVLGGDGGMCMHGPGGGSIIVGEHQNLNIRRSTDDGASWTNANGGIAGNEPHPWVGILVVDPSDRNNMWTGTSRVYRSLDARATNWVAVSGPLYFSLAVNAIDVAPSDSNTVYVGFSAGGLYKTINGLDATVDWQDIRRPNLPQTRTVRRIRVHPDDANTVYLVYSGFGAGKIWKSSDGGATFADHTGDLPDVPVNDILIDADNPGTLLVATDLAVYRSDDDGATWYGFSDGLPTAAAIEFTYERSNGALRVGTHGRSMWDWQEASAVPVAVPDGTTVAGEQMEVAKLSDTDMRVLWDVRACTARDYNLFYGDLDDVALRTYAGAECGLGTSGRADLPIPSTTSGNAFFVIAASDAAGTEGPHGFDDTGSPVAANGVGFCGITNQDPLATCP